MKGLVPLLVLTSLLAGCAGGAKSFEAVEAPRLEAGYAYAYDVQGRVKADAKVQQTGEPAEEEHVDESFGPVPLMAYQIISTRWSGAEAMYTALAQIDGEPLADLLEDPFPSGRQPLLIRQRDLQVLPAEVKEGALRPDDVGALQTYLDFPLTPGKTWKNEGTGGHIQDMRVDAVLTSKALRVERVDLPNGTVDAVLVRTTLSLPGLAEAVRQGEQRMRQDVDQAEVKMAASTTILTWYAPAIGAVVKESVHSTASVDLRITDEGQDFHAQAHAEVRMLVRLTGVDLRPQADRDEAATLAFIASGASAYDPSGALEIPSGAYRLEARPESARINAAAGEAFAFTVDLVGEAPADQKLLYHLTDASGRRVAQGEGAAGDRFQVPVQGPGTYSLTVRAYDGPHLQAQDAVALVADWVAVLPMECVVAAGQTQECGSEQIPSGRDLQRVHIVYEGGSAMGFAPVPGTLVLSDGRGNEVEAPASMGRATIELESTQGLDATGTWSVSWQPTAGAVERGTLDIRLEYGPEQQAAAMGGAWAVLRTLEATAPLRL